MLFALLAQARKVSNPELEKLIGFRLYGKQLDRLNDSKLVESDKAGRAFAHELSDKGWRWCADELAAGPRRRESSLERAHSLVFGVFARYMSASGLSLADIVGADGSGADDVTDVAARVEAGYQALAPAPGEFVRLRELRLRLAGIPRPDVDSVLTAMFAAQRINLIPQSNQQALSTADRESALRIGGEYKYLISIE